MEIKILQVFYGKDGLPYKDKERQVHFPITGTGFLGASNTTKIKFYYDELDNLDETTWVAVSKLPNGKVGSRVLESHLDSTLNEHYALLELDSYYTQYKGDVFISLQGYQGGVNLDYNEETSLYEIHGTPTIAATGSIKFTINYANQFIGSGETDNVNFQRILADLGTKLGIRAYSEYVEELPSVGQSNIFYVVNDDPSNPNLANIYIWNSETQHYVWVGDNTLNLGDYYTQEQGDSFEEEINTKVRDIRIELQSVASGSPKGVYATVDALTTADPNHDYIYLVDEDGYWYYWNTTNEEWTAGGIYQASGGYEELNEKLNGIYELDIDIGSFTSGKYINESGNEGNAGDSKCSGFVDVLPNRTLKAKDVNCSGSRSICEYDENQSFIKCTYTDQGDEPNFEFKTTALTKYIRFTALTEQNPYLFYSKVLEEELEPLENGVSKLNKTIYENGGEEQAESYYAKIIAGYTRVDILYSLKNNENYLRIVNNNNTTYKFYIYGKNEDDVSWTDVSSSWETTSELEFDGTFAYEQLRIYVAKIDGSGFNNQDVENLYTTVFEVYYKLIGINTIVNDQIEKYEFPRLFYLRKKFNAEYVDPYLAEDSEDGITISAGGYYFIYYRMYSVLQGKAIVRLKDDDPTKTILVGKGVGTTSSEPFYSMIYNAEDGYKYVEIDKSLFSSSYPMLCVRLDNRTGQSSYTFEEITVIDTLALQESNEKPYYVSNAGNDENGGTSSLSPLATVNKALELGASTILICNPGAYNQQINLALSSCSKITIKNACENGRIVFQLNSCVVSNSETQLSGYTKVYYFTTDKTFNQNNIWLFQNNVPDQSTLISDNERNALERGYEYRCEDTKIAKCSSTNLSDALSEIENADSNVYKWYQDGTTIYYSRPYEVSSSYPICASFGDALFSGREDRSLSLEISGIETKYMHFNIISKNQAYISDCKSANNFASGGFIYDRTLDVKFLRCESLRTYYGSNGDGFNGHSYNIGEPYSKQTTCTLIDCWSHDNNDDGYSDHERSEITIIGGLYEYNQKAGITPSYGSHCTCYNVISRNNINGFYYTGTAEESEGGKYGQMTCFNCVAENNNVAQFSSGFVVGGIGNSMLLVSCKSINNSYGYNPNGATNKATLIDCGSINDGTIKGGAGTYIIKNTELVE